MSENENLTNPVEENKSDVPEVETSVDDKIISIKESELKAMHNDVAQNKDKYLRLLAEFDNARKRMDRERLEFIKYANEDLIVEFLGIVDDLERTVNAAKVKHQDDSAFVKGIDLVMNNIDKLLKKNGVKVVEAKGKIFDPHSHEVLMQEERDDCEDNVILEEFQKGYMLGEKVVRTAKVKVGKKKS